MLLFVSMGRDYVSELRPPTGILFAFQVIYEYGELLRNSIDRGNAKNWGKTCPRATSSITNVIWTDPGANPGLCGDGPATKRLSHDTALLA
jgi:hypothetical protein